MAALVQNSLQMELTMLKFVFAIALVCLAGLAPAEVVVKDDTGTTIRLAHPARRIVTLAPYLAETLFAAGGGEKLIGTVAFSNYPETVRKVSLVGGYSRIDLETVIALKPDLIIAWQSGNAPTLIDKLRTLGIPIYVSQPNRIEDVASEIERFGVLAGSGNVGKTAAAKYRERLAALKTRYGNRPVVSTFYEVWNQPLATIGGKQIISSVIRLCGGENVFGQLKSLAPTVTVEAVIAANPEAIVASGMDEARPEWLDEWKRWSAITAVARNNLFFVPPDLIQRHTPRLLDGAEQLCQHLEMARSRRNSTK